MTLAKTKPLKLQSTDKGHLKRISDTEENYLAYLVGSHLVEDNTGVGNITQSASGNTLIGSFVDTYFTVPDGTHPASAITSGSTTSNLYQVAGTASEADSDFRRLVAYDQGVRELADSDLNILVDRINGRIAQSDYLGQFKLGTSAPSADYNLFISNVFTDTISNPTTVNTYNIYRRETQSAPSGILDSDSNPTSLMSVKRTSGNTGDFEGLQRMTTRQVKISLGQRAKTRRAVSGGVGSYQLRSSSQGAPSTGLWRSVGTATNTKKTTAEISYTRGSVFNFTGNYSRNITDNSTRDSTVDFVGDYVGNFTRSFAGNYTGNYSREFVLTRSSNLTLDYTRSSTRTSTRTRVSAYTRTSTRTRVSTYTRDREVTYAGNFIGNYTRTGYYGGNYTGNYTRTLYYIGDYARGNLQYNRTFVGEYIRNSSYVRSFEGNYTGNYTGDYSRTLYYTGDFARTSTRNSTASYTRDSSRFVNEGPFYDGENYFWQEEFGFVDVWWNGSFVGGTLRSGSTTIWDGFDGFTYFRGNAIPGLVGAYEVSRSGTVTYTGNYSRDFTGNYTGLRTSVFTKTSSYTRDFLSTSTRTRNEFYSRTLYYSRGYIGNFLGTSTFTRTRTATGDYTRDSTRTSTRTLTYTRDRITNFVGNFIGNYARSFSGNYGGNYTRDFGGNYAGEFTGNYTRIKPTTYSRTRISTYTRTSTRTRIEDYTTNFSGNYVGNYIGDYTRQRPSTFTRTSTRTDILSFTGTTVQPTTSVIETYTLYVRYA